MIKASDWRRYGNIIAAVCSVMQLRLCEHHFAEMPTARSEQDDRTGLRDGRPASVRISTTFAAHVASARVPEKVDGPTPTQWRVHVSIALRRVAVCLHSQDASVVSSIPTQTLCTIPFHAMPAGLASVGVELYVHAIEHIEVLTSCTGSTSCTGTLALALHRYPCVTQAASES